MPIKLLVGLGNLGDAYQKTRHNAGLLLLQKLSDSCGVQLTPNKYCSALTGQVKLHGVPLTLAFSQGYMNESGSGLKKILKFYKLTISETAIIYDDITLPLGRVKISVGGSSGGHNGVSDVIAKCSDGFVRIRVGIGAKPDKRMDLADYVLGKLDDASLKELLSVDISSITNLLVSKGVSEVQNRFNRNPEQSKDNQKLSTTKD